MADPLPMLQMFDKGIQVRMGQAHVKRWIDDLMPLVTCGVSGGLRGVPGGRKRTAGDMTAGGDEHGGERIMATAGESKEGGPNLPPTDPEDRGPGAHSGRESRPQDRIVPGTFGADEGYGSGGGTRDGDPLAGIKTRSEETGRTADADQDADTEYREDTASGRPPYDPDPRP
jgi:hypothetical protein